MIKRLWNCFFCFLAVCLLIPGTAQAAQMLVPVGRIIGLQLSDDTVTVAAFDDVMGIRAKEAGLKIGDEILKIDGAEIDCTEDVRSALKSCDEDALLTVRRGNKTQDLTIPTTRGSGEPRLGVYLRQGIAGIGTVTFYDPENGAFGALGHGVSNAKGSLLQMTSGSAFDARILSIKKGKSGEPGQLKGSAEAAFAALQKNTPQGVFGVTKQKFPGEPIPAATREEIQTGPAVIRSTIQGQEAQEYSVEIMKIYSADRPDGRNLLIKVTDPQLLETTGGIVQGMSGSPIIQNGRLVGAVTHVLVKDPTTGYGIFIENMLSAAA